MESWLKALIAAACVVVIAGGGYFAWSEYQRSVERAEAQRLAEQRSQKRMCDKLLRELTSGTFTEDWRKLHVTFCVDEGHFSENDLSTQTVRDNIETPRQRSCQDAVNDLRSYDLFDEPEDVRSEGFLQKKVNDCMIDGTLEEADVAHISHRLDAEK